MKYKKIMLILITAIFLVSIAGVCASDVNDTMVASEDNLEIDQTDDAIGVGEDTDLTSFEENEILTEGEQTFTQLNTIINGNNDQNIYLDGNYKYSSGDDNFKDGIIINRDVNIYGNGSIIDGNKEARIFQINGGNVVFYNIAFVNGNAGDDNGGALYGNCKAINCIFKDNKASWNGGAMRDGSAVNCSFSGNRAGWNGGAMYMGSAVNCSFSGNRAGWNGGAMWTGSAVNCSFSSNRAGSGGAIFSGSAVNCSFSGNRAEDDSGWGHAMYGGYSVACTGQEGYRTKDLELHWEVNNFNSTYRSGETLPIKLKNQIDELVAFINYDVVFYKTGNEVKAYHCLSNNDLSFDLPAGNYTAVLKITYPNLDPIAKNITLTINKATLKIEVSVNDTTYPDKVTVSVKSDVGGTYIVKIGDKNENIELATGEAKNVTLNGLAANEVGYIVNVTHDSENYTGFNDTKLVKVFKAVPIINVSSSDVIYPSKVVVNVTADVGGDYVVKVGDKSTIVGLVAGVIKSVEFDLAANEAGYIVNVTHDSENYTGFNDTVKVVVHKATPNIEVSASDAAYPDDVVVSVKSDVSGAYVVKVGGKSETVTLVAGEAKNITFAGLTTNESGYNVNVTYGATENYTDAFNDSETVRVKKGTVKFTAPEVTAVYNINEDMIITLKDGNDRPIGGVNVTVDLNGAKTYTTDSNGQVKVSTKGLAPKAYTARITFNGDDNYINSNKDVKVTVNKATPKLTAKKKTFKSSVKTKKYTIVLKDNTGKAIKKAKVTLKVKGKTYKATTNSKGKAVFKIKNLKKKGKYTAFIKFKGNKYYNKATKKAKIKVIVTFKTVSKGSKDKATVKEIQQALKNNGYYLTYDGHYLKIDGIYHGCTERSVKEFQHDKGLKVTGKVDEKTAKKLGII